MKYGDRIRTTLWTENKALYDAVLTHAEHIKSSTLTTVLTVVLMDDCGHELDRRVL